MCTLIGIHPNSFHFSVQSLVLRNGLFFSLFSSLLHNPSPPPNSHFLQLRFIVFPIDGDEALQLFTEPKMVRRRSAFCQTSKCSILSTAFSTFASTSSFRQNAPPQLQVLLFSIPFSRGIDQCRFGMEQLIAFLKYLSWFR